MRDPRTNIDAPPPVNAPRAWPRSLVLSLVLLGGLVVALLFLFDPARHAFYPVCLFKKTTGYDCPGCGGLRSVHQLLRGDVWQAVQLNAMVVFALPVLGAWTVLRWIKSCGRQPAHHNVAWRWAWALVAGVVSFGIVRNLPFWPFGVTPM
jgi:hypothetical protein